MPIAVIAVLIASAVPDKDTDFGAKTALLYITAPDHRRDAQPWVELAFPGGEGATLSLVTTGKELPTGIDTGVHLLTTDARAAHALISSKGLDVGELLDWESTPLMFSFLDLDGNRFYVSENG